MKKQEVLMENSQKYIKCYLEYCQIQKRLNEKTLRAYQIDLVQFYNFIQPTNILETTPEILLQIFIKNTSLKQ